MIYISIVFMQTVERILLLITKMLFFFQNKTQFLNSGGTDGKIHPDSNKVKSWEVAFEIVHLANLEEFSKDVMIKKMHIKYRYE